MVTSSLKWSQVYMLLLYGRLGSVCSLRGTEVTCRRASGLRKNHGRAVDCLWFAVRAVCLVCRYPVASPSEKFYLESSGKEPQALELDRQDLCRETEPHGKEASCQSDSLSKAPAGQGLTAVIRENLTGRSAVGLQALWHMWITSFSEQAQEVAGIVH